MKPNDSLKVPRNTTLDIDRLPKKLVEFVVELWIKYSFLCFFEKEIRNGTRKDTKKSPGQARIFVLEV